MTRETKVVLVIYFICLALITTIVPWKVNQAIAQGTVLTNSIGYAPIWANRAISDSLEAMTVDFGRVVLEIIAITAIFAIPFVLTLHSEDEEYVEFEDFVNEEGQEEENKEENQQEQNQ